MPRPRKTELESLNLLELVPHRVATWSEDGQKVVLQLPEPERSWRRPLALLSYKIWNKKVRLDEVGSFAWRMLDGRRTVAEVAEMLRQEFAEKAEPAEERLGVLVRMLHSGKLVTYEDRDEAHSRTSLGS
jgi:hypothetical protein